MAPATPEPAPAVAPKPEVKPNPEPPDPKSPEAIARRLGEQWCHQGFGAPGLATQPDCSAVHVEIRERHSEGAVESAVIELELGASFAASARYLYFAANGQIATVELGSGFSSGVGGFSHEMLVDHVRLRNVFGDDAPEWWAEVAVESHDSDMGLCSENGSLTRALVLCTSNKGQLACFNAPLVKIEYDEISRSENPDDKCKPPHFKAKGFAASVKIDGDRVEFSAMPRPINGKDLTQRRRAPYLGRFAIAELLRRAPAAVVIQSS